MITVAIVTPLRFLETIQKVITDHDFDCAFRSYTYDSLTDIDEIYAECKDSCDIILFSGELGYHYMHRHYPDCPIPCFFTVYSIADVLSILLQFHLRHPEVALNRLYLDFLTPQNNYLNIQDYLPPGAAALFFRGARIRLCPHHPTGQRAVAGGKNRLRCQPQYQQFAAVGKAGHSL